MTVHYIHLLLLTPIELLEILGPLGNDIMTSDLVNIRDWLVFRLLS